MRNLHTVFHSGFTNLHSTNSAQRVFFFLYILANTCYLSFLILAILTGVRWHLITVLVFTPQKMKILIQKDTGTPMFIAALLTIVNIQKQSKNPLIDEWMDKEDVMYVHTHTHTHTHTHIHTLEYYTARKKDEILPFATTWMDLEGIILSEISQRKTNTIWFRLYVESKTHMDKQTKSWIRPITSKN